jgi:biopolymer transport protein ExbD
MSQLKDIAEEEHKMEMTPMIDVTFLLLIFFMCTLKFKTLEGKLSAYLPKDVGVNQQDAEPIEKVAITVRIIKEGRKLFPGPDREPYTDATNKRRYVWDYNTRELQYVIANDKTGQLSVLADKLQQIHKRRKAADPDDKVPATIDARGATCYGDIVPVLDAAIEAGFIDITFVGAYDDHLNK